MAGFLSVPVTGWWSKVLSVTPWGRNPSFILGDESVLKYRFWIQQSGKMRQRIDRVVECYQTLQRNMLAARNYPAAGHFHIGEHETQRRRLGFPGEWIGSRAIYKVMAQYGESYWLPAIFLCLMLLLVSGVSTVEMGNTEYEWSSQWSRWDEGFEGWIDNFMENLKGLFYVKHEPFESKNPSNYWRLFFILEKIVSIVFVSLIIVAFRRRFKRY